MKKLKNSASFLCLCVVIILTSLAFFYQKGNTTDGTVGSDSPDKENTLKPSASKGSDEFVNDADASEHSQSSHAEIDYSTYESTTLGISISYPAALQDNLPIETHNLLNYIKESEPYKKHAEALHLKISYLTAQNELKKSRNSAILNVLLYIISLLSAIGTLDVIEAHFGVPFKYSFIIVVTLFILGLFWGIIEYRNHRKL